ncbi:hypothetical protein A1O1_01679 [Capronia coronata CBS 617.96]|uniref:F-box domain-containing protein n=1 Tax=Capronia coronata CBS 617.96 TaxID=1182541 RepID=W9YK62_9EURO|nr:uncharacterized protein A1O1_01679 [Capronia coronata CBS 617.96]EXJ93287.1 hypothetical protein A1O1_01679 [Capronia coronata CBS 617.96]
MPKRRRDDAGEIRPPVKRSRTGSRRNLLDISDEILLRVLFFLPIRDLLKVECVSHRFRSLATDGELWKAKYYDTWVRSRARRAPPSQGREASQQRLKAAKWLQHGYKLRNNPAIDWKRQFKIRTNWASGTARLCEVEVAQPPSPPVIAKVCQGIIFTVDGRAGLRAWSGERTLKAQFRLEPSAEATCMAVETIEGGPHLVLGFADGSFSTYLYQTDGRFEHLLTQHSADGPLMAVALAMPYIMTVSKTKFLALYDMTTPNVARDSRPTASPIARLQSDASFSPVSLSLRRTPGNVTATIAYAFNRLRSGWCLGLQEIRLTPAGALIDSRLTSSLDTPLDGRYEGRDRWGLSTRSASSLPVPLHPQLMSAPTSLSYEHPFLVGTLADNTIMSFLVTSNEEKLEISAGRRLWGHTSAVSGAEVNNRGKAVSISCRGDEIRVWELEAVMTNNSQPKTSTKIKAVHSLSDVAAALARRGTGLGLAVQDLKRELSLTRRWVGFDEEHVVVLGDRDQKQVMALYDFT